MPFLDDPITALTALPVQALVLVLFFSSAIEYVFPPYWGDLIVVVGFSVAAHGTSSPLLLFVAAFAGSMAGATAAFWLGRRYGVRLMIRFSSRRRQRRSSERVRELFRRFGERVLVANRFLPFIRGIMLFGAGAFELRFWSSMLFTALSNLAWIAFLASIGLLSVSTWEEIQTTFEHSTITLGVAVAVAVVGWLAVTILRSAPWSRTGRRDETGGDL